MTKVKNLIKKIFIALIPRSVLNERKKFLIRKEIKEWKMLGCPIPTPHAVKQLIIAEYQKKYGCGILIETGTYLGEMVEAQKYRFEKIISIELGLELFENAKNRFHYDKNVKIVHGDSGKILSEILKDLNEPAIFWLDGHFSSGITAKADKNCPILDELEAILNNTRFDHILLIDDARDFTGIGDYPSIGNLSGYIKNKNPKYQVEVKNDIIRYVIN